MIVNLLQIICNVPLLICFSIGIHQAIGGVREEMFGGLDAAKVLTVRKAREFLRNTSVRLIVLAY